MNIVEIVINTLHDISTKPLYTETLHRFPLAQSPYQLAGVLEAIRHQDDPGLAACLLAHSKQHAFVLSTLARKTIQRRLLIDIQAAIRISEQMPGFVVLGGSPAIFTINEDITTHWILDCLVIGDKTMHGFIVRSQSLPFPENDSIRLHFLTSDYKLHKPGKIALIPPVLGSAIIRRSRLNHKVELKICQRCPLRQKCIAAL